MERILAVDDDEIVLALVRKILEPEGYEVQTCLHTKDAIEAIKNQHYDLIISDLMMPDIDGEAFLNTVKKITQIIPFVFLTANSTLETAIKIMKIGADDYLLKPLNKETILPRIRKVILEKKQELFIKSTEKDKILENYEKKGIFSWKNLYGKKDTTQTNRIMGVLSRNIEQGSGFMWLDMLKTALQGQDEEFDDVLMEKKILNLVVESAEYMRKIITDMNFISTLPEKPYPLNEVSLDSFLERINKYFAQKLFPIVVAHKRKLSLNLPETGSSFNLDINYECLFTILLELLCNAIKYSPDESKILLLINIREIGVHNILEISFWNPPKETRTKNEKGQSYYGIPFEYSESVFELFYTFEDFPVQIPEEEWSQGTGLYIVRKMTEKLNGDIDAKNVTMHTPENTIPYVKVTLSLLLKK